MSCPSRSPPFHHPKSIWRSFWSCNFIHPLWMSLSQVITFSLPACFQTTESTSSFSREVQRRCIRITTYEVTMWRACILMFRFTDNRPFLSRKVLKLMAAGTAGVLYYLNAFVNETLATGCRPQISKRSCNICPTKHYASAIVFEYSLGNFFRQHWRHQ
jgi:hypothetical protein